MTFEQLLRGFLSKPGKEHTLAYQIGNDFSGQTDLQVQGDGAAYARSTVTDDRQPIEFRGHISSERLRALLQLMLDRQVWNTKHSEEKRLDDPSIRIKLQHAGEEQVVRIRISELKLNPDFKAVQTELIKIAEEVSGGKIQESGQ